MNRLLVAACLATVLAAFVSPRAAEAGDSLDVESWLRRPGVKLVVVEFYATWCKPCMEAVPKWKALHDKYRKDGLRLIVVSSRDAGSVCANPGWTPDEVVCDDEGRITDQFGANKLPAAFLWGWQGHMLSRGEHVEAVEAKIEQWMAKAPRVDVDADVVPGAAGIDADGLREAVRAELKRSDKLVVVATDEEREALRSIVRRSLEETRDDKTACEVGKEVSANSLVKATITSGRRPRLQLKLLSAEEGCLVAAGTTAWNPDKPGTSISEAVADMLQKIRTPTQFPWGTGGMSFGGPQAEVKVEGIRKGRQAGPDLSVDSSFLFVGSEPSGASVFIDGEEVGQTPFQDQVPIGQHNVELRLGNLYAPVRKRIRVTEEGAKLNVEMPKTYGVLSVRSKPAGAQIFIDGAPTGAKTPHTFPKRQQGTYQIELRLPLHKSARAEVRLADGKSEDLSLALRPNYGDLAVTSDPPGLEVVLDGKRTGKKTPAQFARLQAGVHEVEVIGAGKRLGLQRPRVEVGKTASTELKLVGFKGLVSVMATHSGTPLQASVTINGEPAGTTPMQRRVAPGAVEVVVAGAGQERVERFTLEPGGKRALNLDLSVASPGPVAEVRTSAPEASSGGASGGVSLGPVLSGGLAIGTGIAAGACFGLAGAARTDADSATTVDDLDAAVSRNDTLQTVGVATGVAAGGLAVTALVLWLLDGDDDPQPTAAVLPGAEGAVVGLRGGF